MDDDTFTQRRHELEQVVLEAARELLQFTRAAAALIPIPDTEPPAFVAIGRAQDIVDDLKATGNLR